MKKILPFILAFFISFSFAQKANGQDYIDFFPSYAGACEPVDVSLINVTFLENPIGIPVHEWYVDGAFYSDLEFPPNIILNEGDHTIELFVRDDTGPKGSATQNLIIFGTIDTFLIHPSAQICPGQKVSFEVRPDPWYVEWDFGGGSLIGGDKYQNNTTHSYPDPGNYTVSLRAENDCGLVNINQDVIVSGTAIPEFEPFIQGSSIICPNEEIKFDVYGDFETYLWDFGDGMTSTEKKPLHTYPDQGPASYIVNLTVVNSCGNSNTKSIDVTIGNNPVADAGFYFETVNFNPDPCPGTDVRFTSNSAGTHFWDFGDGGTSNLRTPLYRFNLPGDYTVKHVVISGCGVADTVTRLIRVMTNPEDAAYNVNFIFDTDLYDYDLLFFLDTISVCPGEQVRFKNMTYYQGEVLYRWSFGDGGSFDGMNAQHFYNVPGMYEVMLTAVTACGGVTSFTRYVKVDNSVSPMVELGIVPEVICPGEKVFFFDDNFNPKNNLRYHVDFGDGNSVTNITDIIDFELYTIAQHNYAAGGPYNYSFKAENLCGNFSEKTGTITIDPDAGRMPFYYVGNSTQSDGSTIPADWSVRNSPEDHQFDIFVTWPAWQPAYGDTFYIFFWYEGLDLGESGNPDGIVKFTSSLITSGEIVTAYVPMNPDGKNDVGMAAGYFCGGQARFDDEPEAWGTLIDGDLLVVNQVPIFPSGFTNIMDVSPGGIVIDPSWDGICNSDKPEGSWYRDMGSGVYAILDLYDDGGGFYYYTMEYRDGLIDYTESSYVSSAPYSYPDFPDISTIELQDEGCGSYLTYSWIKPGADQLQFLPTADDCPGRAEFLDGVFTRMADESDNISVCPGDFVKFQIAGGVSYLWDFGDGNTSTEQFPVHAYASEGVYNAQVSATNACGRVDVLTTKVNISQNNIPFAYFNIDNFEVYRMDSVYFKNEFQIDFGGYIDNNNYVWNFGDGKSSTLKDPVHVFTTPGEYKVRLEVSNRCGSNHYESMIVVRDKQILCDANFEFSMDGTEAYFVDQSFGSPSSYEWDFGTGDISKDQNPIYDFGKDGVYYVQLSIYNNSNGCVSSITKKVIIGDVVCDAGFTFIVNNTTGLVKFTNTSVNGVEFSWDFGDNQVSNLANPEHQYKSMGIFPVCLSILDAASGCQSTYCTEVIVGSQNPIPLKADFSFFVTEDQQKVVFRDLSTGNPTQWYWTTGDGKIYNKASFNHNYSKPGVYRVCMVVFNENNKATSTICKQVVVGDPTCQMDSDFDFFIDNSVMEVKFEDKSKGNPEFWYWTFGDGSSSERKSPKHSYKKEGFYLVTLSIFDATNDCMDHFARFIKIGNVECQADFEMEINPETRKVQYYSTSKGPIQYYYWDFGNGKYSKQKNPVVTYNKTGLYPVSLTVIDSNLVCMDISVREVQVGEIECSAGFNYYVDSLNLMARFKINQIGTSTQVLWIFGDGTYNTKPNPVHKFAAPGFYRVSLNTFNSENNCMDYSEEYLLVGNEGLDCQSDFIFQPQDDGLTVKFKERSTGDVQYQNWNFGDGNTSVEKNPEHSYDTPGYYLTCLTIYNNFGIPNVICKWVPLVSDEDSRCRTDFMFTVDSVSRTVKFIDVSYGDPDSWTWEFGDGTSSIEQNPVKVFAEKGFYPVLLKTTNASTGCSSRELKVLNVGDENILKAGFTYEALDEGKKVKGYPVDFVGASSGDGASYEWDFGDDKLKSFTVMDSTTRIVTHYYELPGTYTACLRISDPITGQTDIYCESVQTGAFVPVDLFKDNVYQLKTYPNPASDYSFIQFNLPEREFIEIAIFDELGRRIETLVRTEKPEGEHEILWDASRHHTGIYHIKFMTRNSTIVKALVIAR